MGIISRRVVPACGNVCVFCPSLRPRSRQPVKRYKKLLADVFPRNKEAEPNDRNIGKLCEYASKNPLRIPKITEQLEQKCYKHLRNENFGPAKVVLCIYRKLLSSCKEQMTLFANSLLGIVRTLLEQTHHDEIRVLGCTTLVDFISCQRDSTYTFHLEGLIPKLCELAREDGDDERALCLRSAGLRALAFMLRFMGENSHISMDIDTIILVTLENYMDLQLNSETAKQDRQYPETVDKWVRGAHKEEGSYLFLSDINQKIPSEPNLNTDLDLTMDKFKSPSYWSRACFCNMARLAKEANTVRCVLQPLFHTFDAENHWSHEKGVACSVLMYLQFLLKESGESSHLLLSILVKHLDHEIVSKQPQLQINIVDVITQLARNLSQQSSAAIITAITNLIKHLQKCMLHSTELSTLIDERDKRNTELQTRLETCISQLANKVGDVGPILDALAVTLENLSTNTTIARTKIFSVHRTAQIISSVPNISYHRKMFPDALFHQLLIAMTHPDHESRVGAHSILSIVLMPPLIAPLSNQNVKTKAAPGILSSVDLSKKVRSVSFSFKDVSGNSGRKVRLQDQSVNSSRKVRSESFSFQNEHEVKTSVRNILGKEGSRLDRSLKPGAIYQTHGQLDCFKLALASGKAINSLRLSSHQVSLLLSSIWVQATYAENSPANFEVMAHSYSMAVLLTRAKTSSDAALVQCLQLALSLRSISLDKQGGLQPSLRRSLFTLASYMLIFSARAGTISELIPAVKLSLTNQSDPFLELVEDVRLQAVNVASNSERVIAYGSQEDDIAALSFLSSVKSDDTQLKEIVISHLMTKSGKFSEDELLDMKREIIQGFSTYGPYSSGATLSMDTQESPFPFAKMEFQTFEAVLLPNLLTDGEVSPEPSGSQSGYKTSLSISAFDILSVNELQASVLETATQIASSPSFSTPIPYDQVKTQCEALVTSKQQKMSFFQSFKPLEASNKNDVSEDEQIGTNDHISLCLPEHQQRSFRLPPSSPYENFMKAAGC